MSLVSQTTSSLPQVLLLGEDSLIVKLTQQIYQDNGFELVFIPLSDFAHQDFSGQLANHQFYKIVLVYDFKTNDSELLHKIIAFLQARQEPLITISPLPRLLRVIKAEYKKIFDKWVDKSIKIQKNNKLIMSLTGMHILALDAVSSDKISYPSNIFFQAIKQQLVLDPQFDFFIISFINLMQHIGKLLVKPFEAKTYVFQGKQQSSSALVASIRNYYQRYYQKELAPRKIDLKTNFVYPQEAVKVTLQEDLAAYLDKQVRLIPKILADLPQEVFAKQKNELSFESAPHLNKQSTTTIQIDENKQTKAKSNLEKKKRAEKLGLNSEIEQKNKAVIVKKEAIQPDKQVEQKIESQLNSIFSQERVEETVKRKVKKAKKTKKIVKKSKRKKTLFILGLIFTFFGGSFLLAAAIFTISFIQVKNIFIKDLDNLQQNYFQKDIQTNNNFWQGFLEKQVGVYSSKFTLEVFDQAQLFLQISQDLEQALTIADKQNQLKQELFKQIVVGVGSIETKDLIDELAVSTQELFELFAQIQAKQKLLNLNLKADKQESVDQFKELLLQEQKNLSKQLKIQQHLSDLLGVDKKKTYALLLQDNQELRSSGGFIQAVAILTFDKGQFIDQQVYGVYQLDQMMPGIIDLPAEMQAYIGEKNWYFHDSNWDVDFTKASSKIAWFLKQATNKQIDGVITLNYNQAAQLLGLLGEINLPGFQENLNDKNFFNRAEQVLENQVSPDTNKYFAQEILEQLIIKVKNLPENKINQFAELSFNNFEDNQQLITVFQPQLSKLFADLAWDGSINIPQCPSAFLSDSCIKDFFYLSETNIGLNKINQYVIRKVNREIYLEPDSLEHHYSIEFNNTATNNNYPLGEYKNYLRIFLPKNSQLEEISLNGQALSAEDYYQTSTNKYAVIGLVVQIPIQAKQKLTLVYQQDLAEQPPFSYVFLNQKQAGVSPTPITTIIHPHPSMKPLLIAPQAEVTAQGIVFETHSQEHDFFAIKFGK